MKIEFEKWPIAIVLLALVLSLLMVLGWSWIHTNSEEVRNIGFIFFAIVGGLLAIWRTSIATKNTNINDRNSFTEIFTKAVEQLGAGTPTCPVIEIRLGGLYALEKLSKDNEEYFRPIIDILASYVRQNAPNKGIFNDNDKTRIDVQTALTIIGRRKLREEFAVLVDLSEVYLPYVDLKNGNFNFASFFNSRMKGANLRGGLFMGANFNLCYMANSEFDSAALDGADIYHAYLIGSKKLTCEQLRTTLGFQSSLRGPELSCGFEIPSKIDVSKG